VIASLLFQLDAGGFAGFFYYFSEGDVVGSCYDAAVFVFGGDCGWCIFRPGELYSDFAVSGFYFPGFAR
jgi:hypothetical protein